MPCPNPIQSSLEAWRERAAEFRALAEGAQSDLGRASYLELAENCVLMAERLNRELVGSSEAAERS